MNVALTEYEHVIVINFTVTVLDFSPNLCLNTATVYATIKVFCNYTTAKAYSRSFDPRLI